MKLAKPCVDIGLFTSRPRDLIAFWCDAVGAVFDHVLPIRPGHNQHRLDLVGSVLKINALENLPETPPSGYRELVVARPGLSAPQLLVDPDGNRVTLSPPGYREVEQVGVVIASPNPAAQRNFFQNVLGLQPAGEEAFRAGQSVFVVEPSETSYRDPEIIGPGWRYTTLQIYDAEREHERFLAAGGRAGTAMQRLRDVALFVMVRDPDGNWIELSQRASLTGPFALA